MWKVWGSSTTTKLWKFVYGEMVYSNRNGSLGGKNPCEGVMKGFKGGSAQQAFENRGLVLEDRRRTWD